MQITDIRLVIDTWVTQYQELASVESVRWIQIFENRGAMMGASNPHPHCQIWASSSLPNEPSKEQAAQDAYYSNKGRPLLGDYLKIERAQGDRLICSNSHFTALVPFWAMWPFEALVLCNRLVSSIHELSEEERDGLADILKKLTTRYDNLFETSFPYSMGFHQKPVDRFAHPEWQLHLHFYPPLLRSASVKKFMVGYELLAMPQRDMTAESAAKRLRNVSEHHHLEA
jgi:UDPglucose--hexose-1-phosphate uridylyltransferase